MVYSIVFVKTRDFCLIGQHCFKSRPLRIMFDVFKNVFHVIMLYIGLLIVRLCFVSEIVLFID